MICLICRQAEVVEGFTVVTFERGEFKLVVTRVPARVCPRCGEAYVEESTAIQLLNIARQSSSLAIPDTQTEYSHP
jgi:YgiT-type zinc finger domain-containing protein